MTFLGCILRSGTRTLIVSCNHYNAKETINQNLHLEQSVHKLEKLLDDKPVNIDNLFTGEVLYSGTWESQSEYSSVTDLHNDDSFKSKNLQSDVFKSTPFDGKFHTNKGAEDVVFFRTDGAERYLQLHFIDGFYVDQQQCYVRVDLKDSYDEKNSSFYYKGDFNYTRIMEFNNVLR